MEEFEFMETFYELPDLDGFSMDFHLVDLHHSILVFYGIENDLRRYGHLCFRDEIETLYRMYMSFPGLDDKAKARIKLTLYKLQAIVLHEKNKFINR